MGVEQLSSQTRASTGLLALVRDTGIHFLPQVRPCRSELNEKKASSRDHELTCNTAV
jgi:hypothetical protein